MPCTSRVQKHRGHGSKSLILSFGIWWVKLNSHHLELIMSVSLWSFTLYLPTCSMAALLVANIGEEFSRVMTMSLENRFFGLGKWTVWPSSNNKNSFQAISSADHLKSFRNNSWHSSKPIRAYLPLAGFTKQSNEKKSFPTVRRAG